MLSTMEPTSFAARRPAIGTAIGGTYILPPLPNNYSLPPYSSSASQATIPSLSHAQQPILSSQAPVSQASATQSSSQPATTASSESYSRHSPPGYYSVVSTPQQSSFPAYTSTTTPISHAQPQAATTAAPDSYSRPSPSQGYYSEVSTAPQSSFPAYTSQSHPPSQPSPVSSAMTARPLLSVTNAAPMQPPPYPRSFQSYAPMPTLGGSVLSNVGNPNTPLSLVGGIGVHSGHFYNMYNQPHGLSNDRPFKCDVCPQSFNRNHDLKRHKRIHLAVKPYPCSHCDKSFSRKDALKVRFLRLQAPSGWLTLILAAETQTREGLR